jgi:hypothetical protein
MRSISLQYEFEGLQRDGANRLPIAQRRRATPGLDGGKGGFVKSHVPAAAVDARRCYIARFGQFHAQDNGAGLVQPA